MKKTTNHAALFDELANTVKTIGVDKTILVLKNAINTNDRTIRFVVNLVCLEMDVSFDKVKGTVTNEDNINYARGFIVYYVRQSFEIKRWDILRILLNREYNSTLWRAEKLILNLNPKILRHRPFCDKKKKMDELIANHILKQKK
jgi:hypothetical protein